MGAAGEAIAERARRLVGVRFSLHGRAPAEGVDCVGVAALAAGLPLSRVPRDYALRGTAAAVLEGSLRGLGLETVPERAAKAGDILVFAPGARQLHLGILTESSVVHADAGLGRVVERPLPPPWPVLGVWRLPPSGAGEAEWRR